MHLQHEWLDAEGEPAGRLIIAKLIWQCVLWFNLVSSSWSQAGFCSRWWFGLWELWRNMLVHHILSGGQLNRTACALTSGATYRYIYTSPTLIKGSSLLSDQPFLILLMLCNYRWKHVCISIRNVQRTTLISWLQGTSPNSVTKRPKPSRRETQTNFDTMKSIWEAHSLWLYDN